MLNAKHCFTAPSVHSVSDKLALNKPNTICTVSNKILFFLQEHNLPPFLVMTTAIMFFFCLFSLTGFKVINHL